MNRFFCNVCVVAIIAVLGLVNPLSAETIPIFDYNFPASSADLSSGVVTDISPAGNNAHTEGTFAGTGLSSNVPTGMNGNSIDFSSTTGIITDTNLLMDSQSVADNGGFVLDTWIYPTARPASGKTATILSYAGTEQFRMDSSGRATFNVSNNTTGDYLISSGVLSLNTWHHIVGIFDTEGNEAENGVSPVNSNYSGWFVRGALSLYVDDELVDSEANSVKDMWGDQLDRPIGVGKHPTLPGGYFTGLVYNPKVSFVGVVPEPSTLALLGTGLIGLLAYAWRKRK